ncbi:oligosaccharide flippase family protein [Lentisphaerota bacterium WC36G]|nr:oligosaccharide flippase family protein [Lentisphaerae bacterium WC36]
MFHSNSKTQRQVGIILSLATFAVGAAMLLIYTPLVIRFLGKELFGLYTVAFSTVEYLMFIGFGIAGSYVRFFSRYEVKKDHDNLGRLNAVFLLILIAVIALSFVVGVIVLFNLDYILKDRLTAENLHSAQLVIFILLLNMIVDVLCMIFQLYAQAKERFIFNKMTQLLRIILVPTISITLLYCNMSMVGLALGLLIANTILGIVNSYFAMKSLKMKFIFNDLRLSLAKEIFIFSFSLLVISMVDLASRSAGSFIIGRMISLEAVAPYGAAMKLALYYTQVSILTSTIYLPQINLLVSLDEDNNLEINRFFCHIGRWQAIMLLTILCGFIVFGRPFIKLWAGVGYEESFLMTVLLMVAYFFPMVMAGGMMTQVAMNRHSFNAKILPLIMIFNIFLSIIFIFFFGPTGVAFSSVITMGLTYLGIMNFFFVKHLALDIKIFWIRIVKLLPVFSLLGVFGVFLQKIFDFNVIWQLLVAMVIFGVLVVALIGLFILTKDERNKLKHFISLIKDFSLKFLKTFNF